MLLQHFEQGADNKGFFVIFVWHKNYANINEVEENEFFYI